MLHKKNNMMPCLFIDGVHLLAVADEDVFLRSTAKEFANYRLMHICSIGKQ